MTSSKVRTAIVRWLPHAAAAVVLGGLMFWDDAVFNAIRGFQSPFLDWWTDRVSQLRGATLPTAVALILIVAGLVARRRRIRRAGIAMLLAVILAGAFCVAMKEIIGRPGPVADDVSGESWLDAHFGRFPSGHATTLFAAAGALTAFVPPAAVPAYSLAVMVSHERVYRGTHYPSDIFAGMWLGIVVSRFVIFRLKRRGWGEDMPRLHPVPVRQRALAFRWVRRAGRRVDRETAG
jgi:undecaprenyl-diphosphatase